jgi:hypothetical protein
MNPTDSVFQRAVSDLLTEIFDGPPGKEAYLLNPGHPGVLCQLDTIDAIAAPARTASSPPPHPPVAAAPAPAARRRPAAPRASP